MTPDKVSIVIPAFNAEEFVSDAIQSVLDQTYQNFEILIVDDGSSDNTAEVINGWSQKDHRITSIHSTNFGQSVARNNAILNSTGEFIAFLDADDMWHPQKLELQLNHIQKKGSILLYNERLEFWPTSDIEGQITQTIDSLTTTKLELPELLYRNPIHTSSVLIKRNMLAHSGIFDPRLRAGQDFELFARIGNDYPMERSNQTLSYYRQHPTNTVKGKKYHYNMNLTFRALYAFFYDESLLKIIEQELYQNTQFLAYDAAEQGDLKTAQKHFLTLFKMQPNIRWLVKSLLLKWKSHGRELETTSG